MTSTIELVPGSACGLWHWCIDGRNLPDVTVSMHSDGSRWRLVQDSLDGVRLRTGWDTRNRVILDATVGRWAERWERVEVESGTDLRWVPFMRETP